MTPLQHSSTIHVYHPQSTVIDRQPTKYSQRLGVKANEWRWSKEQLYVLPMHLFTNQSIPHRYQSLPNSAYRFTDPLPYYSPEKCAFVLVSRLISNQSFSSFKSVACEASHARDCFRITIDSFRSYHMFVLPLSSLLRSVTSQQTTFLPPQSKTKSAPAARTWRSSTSQSVRRHRLRRHRWS